MEPLISGTLKALRNEVEELSIERYAIAVLINGWKRERRGILEAQVDQASKIQSRKHLGENIKLLRRAVEELRQKSGMRLNRRELVDLVAHMENEPPNEICWVQKGLLSTWLTYYDKMRWPAHYRIGIDVHGVYPAPAIQYRAPEISLYEDMCVLYNQAASESKHVDPDRKEKSALKRTAAFDRATLSTAFYFVEAYLNGIAFDFVASRGATLSSEQLSVLTEWDEKKQRTKFVSTRDKLLQYPRIITGASHPPLTEDNCPELAVITEKAKAFRDSIVHASPALERTTLLPEKEYALYGIAIQGVSEVVDASISLVRKIEILIHGDDSQINWLQARSDVFGNSVLD
jgi:hypothetical protein